MHSIAFDFVRRAKEAEAMVPAAASAETPAAAEGQDSTAAHGANTSSE
jgi:hypothetical protein